jgi:hypothetical protein
MLPVGNDVRAAFTPLALTVDRTQHSSSLPQPEKEEPALCVKARPASNACAGFVVVIVFTPWPPLDECFYRDVSPTDLGVLNVEVAASPSHRRQGSQPVQVMRCMDVGSQFSTASYRIDCSFLVSEFRFRTRIALLIRHPGD